MRAVFHLLMKASREEGDASACAGLATPVAQPRAQQYERMLASRAQLHTPIPPYDVDPAWRKSAGDVESEVESAAPAEKEKFVAGNPRDMATYLARHMTWYVEFPHVDRTFERVYASLPGYITAAENQR